MRKEKIETDHLLLALMEEEGGIAGRVLRELGMDPDRLREMVERTSGSGNYTGGKIELAPETQKVLELAVEEARRLGHHYIGTEHILLGLARSKGPALDVLGRLGVTPDKIPLPGPLPLKEKASQNRRWLTNWHLT